MRAGISPTWGTDPIGTGSAPLFTTDRRSLMPTPSSPHRQLEDPKTPDDSSMTIEISKPGYVQLGHSRVRSTSGRAGGTPMPSSGEPPGRPDDTVVFLFTDIEASTRRWEGDHNAMAVDLARHDELLRAAVEEAGGRVFAHTGDGMCAAFSTSSRGLTAA